MAGKKAKDDGSWCEFEVRVQPGASRTGLAGQWGELARIRLAAPPVDGAANKELAVFLSRLLKVPRSAVTLVAGQSSRTKRIRVGGVDRATVERLLQAQDS